jgi:hypothetical protein
MRSDGMIVDVSRDWVIADDAQERLRCRDGLERCGIDDLVGRLRDPRESSVAGVRRGTFDGYIAE